MRRAAGFTLIETIFALAIMAGGLLSLAAVFSAGPQRERHPLGAKRIRCQELHAQSVSVPRMRAGI